MDTVGILGGTFDPVHLGHLGMAEAVMGALELRRVLMIPDGDPPHKGELAGGRDRLNMARLAVAGRLGLEVSDIEVKRQGTTYTVDTLRLLTGREMDTGYVYIVGSDTLKVIETWKSFDQVAAMLKGLAVVPRPGDGMDGLRRQAGLITKGYGLDIFLLDKCVSGVSSTLVRQRAARHQSLEGLVPAAVEKYIRSHRLYRDPMLEELRHTMTPARYRHTLGVEETALELAAIHHVDAGKARLAALLHDCAKHMGVQEMKELVHGAGIATAPGEEESRALLHAAAGMALAREKFGVSDPAVLSAIRWHTTGKPGMTPLEQVIYLADMIEPGRRDFPGLDAIRQAARSDLREAMLVAARRTVEYVNSRGMPLNERTVQLLESLEANEKKETRQ